MNNNFSYAIFPLSMLNDEKYNSFSSKEFFLYMLLLNRLNLSKKNGKRFCDKKGYFVIYPQNQIIKDIRCSRTTASVILHNLENTGLIHKETVKGFPTKIYVNDIRENKITIPKPQKSEPSFDIESALQREKVNRINFGEMKNPKSRHKKTT